MALTFFVAVTMLLSLAYAHIAERELYVNFEPLPNQQDSWPVARAAIVTHRSEAGREFTECRMLGSIEELAREGRSLPEHLIKRTSKAEMDEFERICSAASEAERFMIVPGTKWCGPGNKAANESDLGWLAADKCCRAHDHCDSISQGKSKYGLKNEGEYTLLNCDCEKAFHKCLTETADSQNWITSKPTQGIRYTYFTLYKPKCYKVSCGGGRSAIESRKCSNLVATWKNSYLD
uniref:Putative phospholipase n=1 Tax=Superstitionia donensis TaxID=311983 RepID=A0A1V1WBH9_9SCOR